MKSGTLRIAEDIGECQSLWDKLIPQEKITDLWSVRACFHQEYNNKLFFIVVEDNDEVIGFLPLSWSAENNCYSFFPGESWSGKTWIEQNRIVVKNKAVLDHMVSFLKNTGKHYCVRYLSPFNDINLENTVVDEIDYLFRPPDHDYETYFQLFSKQSKKKLRKLLSFFDEQGVEIRVNHLPDFDLMIKMNVDRYGESSYYYDQRFVNSFRNMLNFFMDNNYLRLVTVLVSGVPAAVDFGSVYNGVYTLLAGGVDQNFPGIAKYINLFHMRWSCEEKLQEVDFLCGDFNWKPMFHLFARPLYKISDELLEKVGNLTVPNLIESVSGV